MCKYLLLYTASGYANARHFYVRRYIACIVSRTCFVGCEPRTLPIVMHKVCIVKVVLAVSEPTFRFRVEVSGWYEIGRYR